MLRRLARDESGMAMGLAVITMVLVGVMGAGLLVFVRGDLGAVVEVNQGQKAFELAEAGAQAARAQMLVDAKSQSYDGADGDDSVWSYAGAGRTLTLDGGTATANIRYLPAVTAPASPTQDQAPEVIPVGSTELPGGRLYFKVTSEGVNGQARRKVEAIYRTDDYLPKAFYARRDILINSNATTLTNVSMFAGRNVQQVRTTTLQGVDQAYGDWNRPPWNNVSRPGGSAPGAGAGGNVSYQSGAGGRRNRLDFDSGSSPKFNPNPSYPYTDPPSTNPAGEISFPFDSRAEINVDVLRQVAMDNGTYFSEASGGTHNITEASYPNPSTSDTVYFVEFTGGTPSSNRVVYKVADATRRGTVVVLNAGLDTSSSSAGYNGVFIVRDTDTTDSIVPLYTDTGSFLLQGFVNIDGDMKLNGNVDPSLSADSKKLRSGTYGVQLWSWRELYR